jgi:electron transfer flavoprotein alpha subunit
LTNSLCGTISKRFGVQVARGVSRAAVEQGFIERAYQIGQTGTSVAPKLYLALGISGAIQHMIGVSNSETIVAINSDPKAPILKQTDYYMVSKAEDIVPQFVKKIESI